MPIVFTVRGIRFFFYSNEGSPREPIHIHVRKGSSLAKFWIDPHISLAESWGFTAKELNQIAGIIRRRKLEIEGAWHEHFES